MNKLNYLLICLLSFISIRFANVTATSLYFYLVALVYALSAFHKPRISGFLMASLLGLIPLAQLLSGNTSSIVVLFFYSGFLLLAFWSFCLPYESKNIFMPSLDSVVKSFYFLSFIQLVVQILQLSSYIFNFDVSLLNQLVVPVADLSSSVFVTNGLSMYRFSGIFNQPIECGIFWYSSLMIFFAASKYNRYLLSLSTPGRLSSFYSLLPLFSLLGFLLSGSKILLVAFSSYLLIDLSPRVISFLSRLRIRWRFAISCFLLVFSFFVFLSFPPSQFYEINPLFTAIQQIGVGNINLFVLTAGRISSSDSQSVLIWNNSDFTVFGRGYHVDTYDSGYLYVLYHVGIVGFVLVIALLIALLLGPFLSHGQRDKKFKSLFVLHSVFLLGILLCMSGGSIFTVPKASTLLMIAIAFYARLANLYHRAPAIPFRG